MLNHSVEFTINHSHNFVIPSDHYTLSTFWLLWIWMKCQVLLKLMIFLSEVFNVFDIKLVSPNCGVLLSMELSLHFSHVHKKTQNSKWMKLFQKKRNQLNKNKETHLNEKSNTRKCLNTTLGVMCIKSLSSSKIFKNDYAHLT